MQEVGHIDGSQLVLVTGQANQGSEYDAWPAILCLPKRVDLGITSVDLGIKWYICLHEWLIFVVTVGKYTSPMDSMGYPP